MRLVTEVAGVGLSATGNVLARTLGVLAIVALWRVDRRVAGSLIVPALLPVAKSHYSTLATPVMHPILALRLALSAPGPPVVAIAVYVIWRLGGSIADSQALGDLHDQPAPRVRGEKPMGRAVVELDRRGR